MVDARAESDELVPVTTRSAVLTLLLGAELPALTPREIVATAGVVGFGESAVRVALSRMTASGDLVRQDDGRLRLSERLQLRQRRQDAATHPRRRDWDGGWHVVLVTTTGRPATERAELRAVLGDLRLAEVREGAWTRPANLEVAWPDPVVRDCEIMSGATPPDAARLAADLWDLDGWAARAEALLAATATEDPRLRFTACAAAGRHLLADPVLPEALLPEHWPGERLRASHVAYREWLIAMRRSITGQQPLSRT